MIAFDGKGQPFVKDGADAYEEPGWEDRRFDDRRNWMLAEKLLTDPAVRVQFIFVSNALRFRMLKWAERAKRPEAVVAHARMVMRQPGESIPHDDHFHVRVYCSRADRFHGCSDAGPVWQHEKKTYKYGGPERYDPWMWRVAMLTVSRPFL